MDWLSYIIVVAAAKVDGVGIHATKVGPVVGQGKNQLDAGGLGSLNDGIEDAQVDGHGAVVLKPLSDGVISTGVVLGEAAGNVGAVVVVEGPGSHNLEAGINSSLHADLDIGVVVGTPLDGASVLVFVGSRAQSTP